MTIKGRCGKKICPEAIAEIEKAKTEVVDEVVELLKEKAFSIPTVYNSYFGRMIDAVSEELKKKYTEGGG